MNGTFKRLKLVLHLSNSWVHTDAGWFYHDNQHSHEHNMISSDEFAFVTNFLSSITVTYNYKITASIIDQLFPPPPVPFICSSSYSRLLCTEIVVGL